MSCVQTIHCCCSKDLHRGPDPTQTVRAACSRRTWSVRACVLDVGAMTLTGRHRNPLDERRSKAWARCRLTTGTRRTGSLYTDVLVMRSMRKKVDGVCQTTCWPRRRWPPSTRAFLAADDRTSSDDPGATVHPPRLPSLSLVPTPGRSLMPVERDGLTE